LTVEKNRKQKENSRKQIENSGTTVDNRHQPNTFLAHKNTLKKTFTKASHLKTLSSILGN
jgi:hypothetical protein